MTEQQVNAASNQAFDDALNFKSYAAGDSASYNVADRSFKATVTAPNGNAMHVEGYYKDLPSGQKVVVTCYPSYSAANPWPVIPKQQW